MQNIKVGVTNRELGISSEQIPAARLALNTATSSSLMSISFRNTPHIKSSIKILYSNNYLKKMALTLDFNYIFTCLMWATVSALLCLAVRFYCYFIHVHFMLVL